jgi:hypothetical protein
MKTFEKAILIFLLAGGALAQQVQNTPDELAHSVPVIDGGAGPCSLELHVTADGKPVYAATIKVRIAYGFVGTRKLDLQAATNIDGKVKFTGIPEKVKRPPLLFNASLDKLAGTVEYDPATECQGQHDLALAPARSSDSK